MPNKSHRQNNKIHEFTVTKPKEKKKKQNENHIAKILKKAIAVRLLCYSSRQFPIRFIDNHAF